MKKLFVPLYLAMFLGFLGVSTAHATLFSRGGGLIYDDVLNVTWLQNANLAETETFGMSGISSYGAMNWYAANIWINAMNDASYMGFSDWRLPTNVDGPGVFGYDGSTTYGWNVTSSEMGYMFYVNLGNQGWIATDGSYNPGSSSGLLNFSFIDGDTGNIMSFMNLQSYEYWSGTEVGFRQSSAWAFDFATGNQHTGLKSATGYPSIYYAWAVRSGDVAPVPEPHSVVLLLTGLGFLGRAFKRRQA